METFAVVPGSAVKKQVVFSLLDGSPRAWNVAADNGQVVLVATPFDAAKSDVEAGRSVELPLGVVTSAYIGRAVPLHSIEGDGSRGSHGGCGCQKKLEVEVDVAIAQKTAMIAVGRGKLVTGRSAREPLMAVAEGKTNRVACCGGDCGDGPGTPNMLVFDRYRSGEDGYAVAESIEHAMPESLCKHYASPGPSCLPWVRVQRDPERFRKCLAQARKVGPIDDSKKIIKLVGDYMSRQDSEVFLVVLLDTQLQVRGISEVARGARDRVEVPVPDVLRIAIVDGATGIVVVHCHPSGVAKPSESDVELTKTIQEACKKVHLELIDHVIVAGDRYYSFAKEKKL